MTTRGVLMVGFAIFSLLVLVLLARLLVVGSTVDKVSTADLLGTILTFQLGTAGALGGSEYYMDAALVVALLSFISTFAMVSFVTRERLF